MKTETLQFALKLVQPCVVGVDFIPVLQHFCFEQKRLYAYDEVSAIIVTLDTELHCAVHAATLVKLLELSGTDVKLTATQNKTVLVESGASVVELPALDADQFVFEEPRARDRSTIRFALTPEALVALQLCAAGTGNNPHYRGQTAVTLCTGKASAMYAFDGTSLVKSTLTEALGEETRHVLVPKSVCDQILGLTAALHCDVDPDITVNLSSDRLMVEFTQNAEAIAAVGTWQVRLLGKLLSEAPTVEAFESAIAQAHGGNKLVPITEEFTQAVEKVAVVVANDVEKVCRLTLNGEGLSVQGKGALGVAHTALDGLVGQKVKAAVEPERLTRYKGKLTHIAINSDRIAMYNDKKPGKATLTYVAACYA